MKTLVSFGSDNHAAVHPQLMEAMLQVNQGYSPAYGLDPYSQRLKNQVLDIFDAADMALVFNGTAANVICLQLATRSYHSVIVSDCSHLHIDECGAPEKIAGCKLIAVPSKNGKISPKSMEQALIRKGDQHFSQVQAVSITQPTEYGTVYSLEELKEIHQFCKKHDLFLHIDGARLANAAVSLNSSFKQLTQYADVISFGGAKNGLLLGELVVVRNPNLKKGLKFIRKQSLQLPSKMRFLSAPFTKYLEDDIWHDIASHENQMAQYMKNGIESSLTVTHPTQANAVFCLIPQHQIKPLRQEFFFYVWDEKTFEVRLMTSFQTSKSEIDLFLHKVKNMAQQSKGLQ